MPAFVLALLAAQAAAAVCPARPLIPTELAGWTTPVSVAARAAPTMIRVGQAARATLLPGGAFIYPLAPAKPGADGTSGGVFAFEALLTGRYRVALGAGAWIDVVRDGAALASVQHGHGGACSTVRKMVDFDLTAGRHLLQIAGSPTAMLTIMVVRVR